MLSKFRKNEQGFTLIELLIVVAIIGILAAIAIPQFSAYRQRAFNSAAQSDVRNARVASESLFADFQLYGATDGNNTLVAATGTSGAGAAEVIDGGAALAAGNINALATSTAGQAVEIGVSSNVQLVAETDATFASSVIVAKHRQGNRAFAMDSDSTILYFAQNTTWVGTAAGTVSAVVPASTVNTDNFTAVAAGGSPVANWTAL